jgi:WD40 repeat protein
VPDRAPGSDVGTIKLWDPASGDCEATLEGHALWVNAPAGLADGRLASGSYDKSLRICESRDHRSAGLVQFIGEAGITALAIVPDPSVLTAGDESGRVLFLRIEGVPTSGETLTSLFYCNADDAHRNS